MKNIKIFFTALCILLCAAGCEQDTGLYDFTRYKFVSFIDQDVEVAETYSVDAKSQGKEEGYPLYLKYDGSTLNEDFTVTINIEETVAKAGVDYEVVSQEVLFKAGEILSEPFYLKILDNLVTNEERKLKLEIASVSNPAISIGVGVVNQTNKDLVLKIVDNECEDDLSKFASGSLSLTSNKGTASITATVDQGASTIRFEGDLVGYGPLANTSLEVDMTPVQGGAKIGSVTFEDYYAGKDTDGWEYTYKMEQAGSYDICAGSVTDLGFGVYYLSGGSWVYWYSVEADMVLQ